MMKLEKLNKCLFDFCFPLYQRMLPPLNREEIELYFKKWRINDAEIEQIFLWKNGIPYDEKLPTYSFDFTGFGVIPTLTEIDKIIAIDAAHPYWRNTLFPLVSSFAGDFLLYETNKASDNYGHLFLYSPNLGYVDYQIGYYDSIDSMIETIIECFETGVFVYDSSLMSLEINYPIHSEIAQRYNPKSEYWQ